MGRLAALAAALAAAAAAAAVAIASAAVATETKGHESSTLGTACSLPTTYGPVTLPGPARNASSWAGYARVSPTAAIFYHLSEATGEGAGPGHAVRDGDARAPLAPPPPPLLVWSNGGPGASSVLYGDFFQNVGPFRVVGDGPNAVAELNPDAIATRFATLFIDHPVPTGLSVFCDANGTGPQPPGTQEANAVQYVAAVRAVLERHPGFAGRDVYLAGESYAGRFLPAIATEARSADPQGLGAAIKGLMIGNGEVDAAAAFASYGPFMFAIGFLTEHQRDDLAEVSARCAAAVKAEDWAGATSVCYTIRAKVSEWTGPGGFFDEDIRSGNDPFADEMTAVGRFVDRADVRAALHATPLSVKPSASTDGKQAWRNFNASGDFCKSAVPLLPAILGDGKLPAVRVLIYTGVFDEVMNVLSTANWLATLAWSGAGDFLQLNRTKYELNGTTVGYHRRHGTLSQMHVLRAGHFATKQQPVVMRDVFLQFVAGEL